MWYVWSLYTIYWNVIHKHLMQLYFYQRNENQYLKLLPSHQVSTRFLLICLPMKLHWPRRAIISSYFSTAPHNNLWRLVATSLATIPSTGIFFQLMSHRFCAGLNHFILMLNLISNRSLARHVACVRQPLIQICFEALHWAALHVL